MIDPTADRPVFRQLADLLRGQIDAGELAPGQFLPSEGRLVEEYDVGRDTARAALAALRAEGVVVTVPRVGTYVRGVEDVTVVRVEPGARVSARMPASDERRRLGIPEGTPVLVVAREGREDDVLPADRTVIQVES